LGLAALGRKLVAIAGVRLGATLASRGQRSAAMGRVDGHYYFHLAKLLIVALALVIGAAPKAGLGASPVGDCPAPPPPAQSADAPLGALSATPVKAGATPKVGSMTSTLPPGCGKVVYRGQPYARCGAVWYRPRYTGFAVNFIVIKPPC
jgi:hypothetical protein